MAVETIYCLLFVDCRLSNVECLFLNSMFHFTRHRHPKRINFKLVLHHVRCDLEKSHLNF